MKYIRRIVLKNFQSHKHTTIDLDEGLNVIVGPSDSGKSAIIRGIRWALFNEPLGTYFIREGEQECSVTIEFNDGSKIKRYRSTSKNIYYLYNSNNEEIKYEGFGTTVPEEIQDYIGIQKILLDNEESKAINLGEQLEGAFLISEKTSTRAASIGRLVGVNLIDDALRESLKDSRNHNNIKKNLDEDVVKFQDELKSFDYLKDLKETLNQLEIIKTKILTYEKQLEDLGSLFKKYNNVVGEIQEIESYIGELEKIDELEEKVQGLSTKIGRYNYLNIQLNKIKTIKKDKLEDMEIIEAFQEIHRSNELISQLPHLIERRNKLYRLSCNYNENGRQIKLEDNLNKRLESLNTVEIKANEIDRYQNQLNRLTKAYSQWSSIQKSLAIGETYVKRFEGIENIEALNKEIDLKIGKLKTIKEIQEKFNKYRESTKEELEAIDVQEEKIKFYLDRYEEILLKYEICPLCFSHIDNIKIDHIISHYNEEG